MIENHGLEYTRSWTKKFVTNFSRKPKGNDRAQILSVASGESKLAIANTYYYGLMLSGKKGKEQKEAAKKVRPFFSKSAKPRDTYEYFGNWSIKTFT